MKRLQGTSSVNGMKDPTGRITRRTFLDRAGWALAGGAIAGAMGPLAGKEMAVMSGHIGRRRRKPNIVLLFSDDQGWPDLGCFGSPDIRTPHLDQMADSGVRLTDFYVTSSVCTPSRSGLLTGRYPHRNGLYENIRSNMTDYKHRYNELEYVFSPEMTQGLDVREVTLAQVLKKAGYQTGIFGKWDSGRAPQFLPLQRGFDDFFGFANTGIDFYTHERYGMPSMFRGNQRVKVEGYATDLFCDEALRFIDENRERPFFLYVPFNAPHGASNLDYRGPQAPEAYVRQYAHLDDRRQRYAAAITCMDDAIGRILARLQQHGLEEDTLVIFTSDNGGYQNGPLRGRKGNLYEGGIRVPFVARWPGRIPAGQEKNDFCSTLDLLPTFADIAGAKGPKGVTLDGYNMLPVLTGEGTSNRTEQYWELRSHRAMRAGHWKWVLPAEQKWVPPQDETGELYDLSIDVGEQRNLVAERPDVLKDLQARWRAWFTEMAQTEPRGPFSKAYFDKLGFGPGHYRLEK